MFSRIGTSLYDSQDYQRQQQQTQQQYYNRTDPTKDYDSKQEIDLLVDKFREVSLRRKEKERDLQKKKREKHPKRQQQQQPVSTQGQGIPALEQDRLLTRRSQTCHGPTLRFMKKVFFSASVHVSGRAEQQLPSYLQDEFVVKCLVWHNIFRSRHQADPLQLSFRLCHEAQRLANQIAHTGRICYQEALKSLPGYPMDSYSLEGIGGNGVGTRAALGQSISAEQRDFGQSLYVKYQPLLLVDSRMDVTAKEVVKHWYHRGSLRYNHSLRPDVLHTQGSTFSQLVWRKSTELGIGKARSIQNEAKVIVVALYTPRGNIPGLFLDNVRPYVKINTTPDGSDDSASDDHEDADAHGGGGEGPKAP